MRPVIVTWPIFKAHRHSGQVFIDHQPHLSVRQSERSKGGEWRALLELTRWATWVSAFNPAESVCGIALAPLADMSSCRCPVHSMRPATNSGLAAAQLELPRYSQHALRDHLAPVVDQTLNRAGHAQLSARCSNCAYAPALARSVLRSNSN